MSRPTPNSGRRWSVFQMVVQGTSGIVVLAMFGAAAVQFRSDVGLLGVVLLGGAFLTVAVLLLLASAKRGSSPGWRPTLYCLASTLLIALTILVFTIAWGGTGISTVAAPVTEAVLAVAVFASIVTCVLSFIPSARGLGR